eukprot:6221281-Ditylum_brightwellii.AAC.1
MHESDNNNQVYKESSHVFIYEDKISLPDGTIHTVRVVDRLCAYLIISVQCSIYLYLTVLAKGTIPAEVTTHIDDEYCENDRCNPGDQHPAAFVVAVISLSVFILPDVACAMRLWGRSKRAKLAAVLIFCEAILGLATGFFFAHAGPVRSSIDQFLGVVCVLFVHDLDQQLRLVMDMLKRPWISIPYLVVFLGICYRILEEADFSSLY